MCFPFFIVLSAGLPRRLFLPHAVAEGPQLFAQSQIFAVAVDDEFGLVEAELTVLVQQALVHVAGRYFGEEEVVAAQRDDLRDPALEVDGAFFLILPAGAPLVLPEAFFIPKNAALRG